ncbi:MAG: hypothetical protein MJY75_06880, partial [Bacteroidaceae bacterium]|nr:hypothetical protein [Bacteroidaceae bacterium]
PAREEAYFLWTIGMEVVFSCVFVPYRVGAAREEAYFLWTIGMEVAVCPTRHFADSQIHCSFASYIYNDTED